MQAVLHETFGAPTEALRLAETDAPPLDDHEVLVGVRATSVARGDWLMTRGLPYIARPSYGLRNPKHQIAGLDVAGVVRAVGPRSPGFGSAMRSSAGDTGRSPSTRRSPRRS